MKVRHLDELYTWKQIRKLQSIHWFSQHNGFVPVAIYAQDGGCESHYGGSNDYYGWYGKQSAYYARMLWESARRRLADVEAEALAFDIVEASECFNTIRFKAPDRARDYCAEFKRLMRSLADNGDVKCAIGRAPARPHPWDSTKRLEEVIISDDAEYTPNVSHDPKYDNTIPEYRETAPLGWNAVERFFIELSEDELAFLNGEKFVNKTPTQLDRDLHDACEKLDLAKVESLLDAGANPNSTSGDPCYDTLLTDLFQGAADLRSSEPPIDKVRGIIDTLVSHGCDLDFSPYESAAPMYEAIHFSPGFLEYLIEKGANPNTVSWIGLYDWPATPLDHAADDIGAYGEDPDLNARFDLIKKAGGKFFSEIVPNFYEDD